jgi:DNA-binding response OmpR family regulator
LETIRALRKEAPDIRIIAVSGAFGGQFLRVARMLGADDVLRKPISAAALQARVAELINRRRD